MKITDYSSNSHINEQRFKTNFEVFSRIGATDAGGVWKDVARAFAGADIAKLYDDLEKVNSIRNTHVAHVETRLSDAGEAWEAMSVWLRCLNQMVSAAG